MPQIPVYNSPQVDRADVPGVRQSVGGVNAVAFGASNTFDQLGDMANVVIQQQAKEGERKAAEDAMRAQSEFQREVIGKQNEWRQRQGKNAEGVDKEADAWMEETADKYIKGLKDPRAVQLFDQKAMQQRTNMLDWATGHVTQQREVALDVEFNSAKQVAMDTALNDSRPQIVNQSIADIRQKNAFMAKHKGYDDNWLQAQNSKDIEKLHGGILQNAMDQDSVSGVAGYLQAHGSEMDAGMRGKAEKWIHKKTIDETAGAYADELINNGVPLSEALSGARSRFSGDDEDAYVRAIKEGYGEREQVRREQEREITDSINREIANTGDLTKIKPEHMDWLKENAPERYIKLKESQDEALDMKAAGMTGRKYSDSDKLDELQKRLNEHTLLEPELEYYKPFLSDDDYKSAKKGLDKNQAISDSELEAAYRLGAPDSLRKKPINKWTPEETADFFYFKNVARNQVRELATPEAANTLSAAMWREGKLKGSGYKIPFTDMTIGDEKSTALDAARSGKLNAWQGPDVERTPVTAAGLDAEARLEQVQQPQPQFSVGQRAKQNGITYEFDGANWNPVE